MAQALGKDVIAEGIETERQLEGLRELGCNAGQAYLFSRSQPRAAMRDWLLERLSG